MSMFHGPFNNLNFGEQHFGNGDLIVRFDAARRFVDEHRDRFDDPGGVSADLNELERVTSGAGRPDSHRVERTIRRLERTAPVAEPVAAVAAAARHALGL